MSETLWWKAPADTTRQDIARECLHLACAIDASSTATIDRAQAYFDWVMRQGCQLNIHNNVVTDAKE